jgi:threonine dehydrogenase-like Zn-dependent dehydrogenase
MTEQQNAPVEQSGEPVAAPENQDVKSTIAYDTHRKLLDEKKKVQAQLDQLLREKTEREEADARKRGDFEALLKAREEELAKERTARQELSERITTGRKLNAVIEALGGNIDQKWLRLIDTDEVAVNPETGEVDAMTVARAAESLKKQWPEMIRKTVTLPASAPVGNQGGTISRADWLKLSSKDMLKYKPDQILG